MSASRRARALRIGLALVATAVSAAALAWLAPPARQAGALLLAQDDPARLSDVRLGAVLRTNDAFIDFLLVSKPTKVIRNSTYDSFA